MTVTRQTRMGLALLLAAALGSTTLAQAQEELGRFARTIKPYALIGYTYDSNLIRLSGEDAALILLGDDSLSDSYATYEFGIDTLWERGANQLELSGRAFSNVYNRFSGIDYAGGNALAQWSWDTSVWNGKLGYRYNRSLRDFANQVIPRKDIRSSNAFLGELGRRFGQRTAVTLRAEVADIFYLDNRFLDQERILAGVSVDVYSRAGNSYGVDAEFIDGTFDRNPLNDYDEVNIGPTLKWNPTGKTRLDAKVGYSRREHTNSPERDFDGITGNVKLDWTTGGDSRVEASIYREISNLGDEIVNFAVVHGIYFRPTWRVSTRTSLRFDLSYEDRDFRGETEDDTLPDAEKRRDKVASGGLWVDWTTEGAWTFSLGLRAEDRTSNRDFANYDFMAAEGTVRFGF